MRKKWIIILVAVAASSALLGVFGEREIRGQGRTLKLRVDFDSRSKGIVVYNYFIEHSGDEVREGDWFWYSAEGTLIEWRRYHSGHIEATRVYMDMTWH